MTLKTRYSQAKALLREDGIDTADLDARLLFQHVFGLSQTDFMTTDFDLTDKQIKEIDAVISRRRSGEPVSKILGYREFYGRRFTLNAHTLDPRPETELLVDRVLDFVSGRPDAHTTEGLDILDLGTGTGCIPITLLCEIQTLKATAVDLSENALAVAQDNARHHNVHDSIRFIHSNWFDDVSGIFDIITSNPPYIPNPDIESLAKDVRNHDPILALDGGEDGFEAYKIIIPKLKLFLKPGGRAFLEIGYAQGKNIQRLVDDSNLYMVGISPDIAGIPRVVEISNGEK